MLQDAVLNRSPRIAPAGSDDAVFNVINLETKGIYPAREIFDALCERLIEDERYGDLSRPDGDNAKKFMEIQPARKIRRLPKPAHRLPGTCQPPAGNLPATCQSPAKTCQRPATNLPGTCQNLPGPPATRPDRPATASTVINGAPTPPERLAWRPG